MEALRGMIGKGGNKSKDNDDHSSTGADTGSAYRSSDASGEPDVGTKSYSRDTGDSRDDWDDRRQNDPGASSSYSSRTGGASGYSSGSSGSTTTGIGSERSVSGYAGGNNPSYSGGDGDYGALRGSDNDPAESSGRRHGSKEHSRRSDKHNDDDTGDMGGGVHGTRGLGGSASHVGRSSGIGMSGGNQSYGSYASADKNED
ncbi:hypothetical protein PHYPSEUDO_009956 [Phytophthora pseudosyringae]|uniref:Uncharacterized protein n=1 Tax=Phytophthora pseudosyringae TaxID=221518 RepID=A0A8T1VEE1_9STRA|nr:hypothetical protein PHYPSEUDO_009956 [Phytophthora pseudosyringae]